MTKTISTTISDEFWQLAQDNKISWAEALKVGLSVIFGDIGIREYDNTLNLHRKMNKFRIIAEESMQKLAELEEMGLISKGRIKIPEAEKPTAEEEMKDASKAGIL